MTMGSLLMTILGLFLVLTLIINGVLNQRYYACDPQCVEKCAALSDESDADEVPICVYIPEVYTEVMEFANECAFQCANKCYELQLRIHHNGSCGSNGPKQTPPPGWKPRTQGTGDDDGADDE